MHLQIAGGGVDRLLVSFFRDNFDCLERSLPHPGMLVLSAGVSIGTFVPVKQVI